MALKQQIKKMIGRRGRLLARRLRTKRWPVAKIYREHLQGKRALEIGGPSDNLGFAGKLPIYSCLSSIDNCNFADETLWKSEAVRYANTFKFEGGDLKVASGSYDCIIASHCLEHMANPIRTLVEWKRVLGKDGMLLMILPHRDFTFDWRRPITTVEHMKKDYEMGTPESDLTHLDEILELHDLSRDPGAGTAEQFRERSLQNAKFRALHHHVFVPETAIELLKEVGFSIIRQDSGQLDIVTLAKSS